MTKALGLYYNRDITNDEELICQINQKMVLAQKMYEVKN